MDGQIYSVVYAMAALIDQVRPILKITVNLYCEYMYKTKKTRYEEQAFFDDVLLY